MGKEMVSLLLVQLGYPTLEGIELQLGRLVDLEYDLAEARVEQDELRKERFELRRTIADKHGELLQLQATVRELQAQLRAYQEAPKGGLSPVMLRDELKATLAITEGALNKANEPIARRYVVTDEHGLTGQLAAALRGVVPRLRSMLEGL